MSKFLRIIIAMCFVFSFTAVYAEENNCIDVEVSGYSAEITGEAECKEGTEVVISVVRPQKDISKIEKDSTSNEETQLFGNVVCIGQTSVDNKGNFSYTVNFDKIEKSGTYLVRCQIYSEEKVREKEIKFVNGEQKTVWENALKNQTETVQNILNNHATELDIEAGEFYNTFTQKQKEYVIDSVSEASSDKKEVFLNSVSQITNVENMKLLSKEALKEFVNKGDIPGVNRTLYSQYTALSSFKKDLFISNMYDYLESVVLPDDVAKAFEKAFEAVDDSKTTPQSQSGGSSSGGSSGISSSSGKSSFSGIVPEPITQGTNEASTDFDEFDDLESTPWAKNAVRVLFEKKIISGKGGNKFCPGDEITREEFLKLVIVSLNIIGVSEKENTFSDVVSGAWYEDIINTAVAAGVVNGMNENTFGIGQSIKRQDMATVLYRAVKYGEVNLYEVAEPKFTDEKMFPDYAKEAITALSKAKVINGMEDGSFMPDKTATRAEAAVMIYNLLYR